LIDKILGDRLGNDDLRKEQENRILALTEVEVSSEEPKEVVEGISPVEPFAELNVEVVKPKRTRRTK
jgi:hypothetical protein